MTYPAYVQDEVEATLDDPSSQFQRGQLTLTTRGSRMITDHVPAVRVPPDQVKSLWGARSLPGL